MMAPALEVNKISRGYWMRLTRGLFCVDGEGRSWHELYDRLLEELEAKEGVG